MVPKVLIAMRLIALKVIEVGRWHTQHMLFEIHFEKIKYAEIFTAEFGGSETWVFLMSLFFVFTHHTLPISNTEFRVVYMHSVAS